MNPKALYSPQFKQFETDFLHWFQILGYSPATIATRKRNIREFLLYLERCGITTIEQTTNDKAKRFVRYLKRRENKLFGSGLMNASINVGISTVNKFFEYLSVSRQAYSKREQVTGQPGIRGRKLQDPQHSLLTGNQPIV